MSDDSTVVNITQETIDSLRKLLDRPMRLPDDAWHPDYGRITEGGKLTEAGKEWMQGMKDQETVQIVKERLRAEFVKFPPGFWK